MGRAGGLALLALALCSSLLVAIAAEEVDAGAAAAVKMLNAGSDEPSAVTQSDAPSEASDALKDELRGELSNNTKGTKGRGGLGARVPKLTADGLAVASKIAAKSAAEGRAPSDGEGAASAPDAEAGDSARFSRLAAGPDCSLTVNLSCGSGWSCGSCGACP